MLELLAYQEPQVTRILTSNTETNEHMIAINETLGYRVLGKAARSWQLSRRSRDGGAGGGYAASPWRS